MRHFLFISIVASSLLISGCYSPTEPQPNGSLLEVKVQFAGSCGTVPVGGQCDATPTPANVPLVIKRLPDMKVVGEVIPDLDGFSRQTLAVGKYQLELKDKSPALRANPVEVQLLDSQMQRVTFTILALRP